MKPEYLIREATINKDSFIDLMSTVVVEEMAETDGIHGLALAMSSGVTLNLILTALQMPQKKAITFTGASYALAAAEVLHETRELGLRTAERRGGDMLDALTEHLGATALLLCEIADKLFDRDEDAEDPEEKDGDEA